MGPPGRRVLQRATAMGIVANYHLYLQQLWWVSCDGPSFLTDWLAGCLAVILSKSRDTQSLTTMMMSQGIFESCCNWRSSIPVCPLRFYEPPLVLQIAHLIPFNCTRNGHCRTMYQPVTTTIEESGNCWSFVDEGLFASSNNSERYYYYYYYWNNCKCDLKCAIVMGGSTYDGLTTK